MLQLLKLKASHGWSDNSFLEHLSLLAKLLPKPNKLPTSKEGYMSTCHNYCILYRKEYELNMKCPVGGVSQYKGSYNHVYANTMKKKIKNKKKTDIGPESADDEAGPD
jgi:hypothetical protein